MFGNPKNGRIVTQIPRKSNVRSFRIPLEAYRGHTNGNT